MAAKRQLIGTNANEVEDRARPGTAGRTGRAAAAGGKTAKSASRPGVRAGVKATATTGTKKRAIGRAKAPAKTGSPASGSEDARQGTGQDPRQGTRQDPRLFGGLSFPKSPGHQDAGRWRPGAPRIREGPDARAGHSASRAMGQRGLGSRAGQPGVVVHLRSRRAFAAAE